MCVSARATTITVSSQTVPGWQYGTPATMRVYVNSTFTDTDGVTHLAQATGGPNFFVAVTCTASGTTLTIPSFTIASTADSPDNPSATYTFIFYDKNGVRRDTWAAAYQIPIILGTTVTWARLRTFMAGHPAPPRPGFPDTQQVQALINAVLPAPKSSDVINGILEISVPPVDSVNPKAIGLNDPRVGRLFNVTGYPYNAVCDGTTADTTAIAAANTAALLLGGAVYIPPSTSGCKIGTATISAQVISDGGSLVLTTGQTTTLTQPPILSNSIFFRNALAGQGTVALTLGPVRPDWWATNTTPGTTGMTAAIVAADAVLSARGSGTMKLQAATYLVTSWTPVTAGIVVEGEGQNATIIRGSGAGAYTVRFNGLSKSHWSNLTIDGGEVKTAAMTMVGATPTSSNVFESVRWKGGTTYSLVLGTAAAADDVSDNTWIGCTVQSDNCSTAQLQLQGTNTSANVYVGGRISTGGSAGGVAVNFLGSSLDGPNMRFVGVNFLGVTYSIIKGSGTINVFGAHVESGGFIHTLSTDPRDDTSTPPDTIEGLSLATSGTDSIYHEAPRTMVVTGTRGGGNIRIGTAARLQGKANGFASGGSYVIEGDGELISNDAAKGSDVLAENNKLAEAFLYSIASAPSKISAFWLFDEDGSATTVTDRGTLSHNLTLSSAANLLTPRNRGLAPSLLFSNSPSNYFSTPDHNDFSFGDGATDTPFTFLVQARPTSLASNVFFGKYNAATGSGEYLFWIDGNSKLALMLSDQSASASIGRIYNTALTDTGTIHVYAATYSGSGSASGIKLYRDGVRVDDTNNNSGVYVAMENTTDVPGNYTFAPGRLVGNARMFTVPIIKEEWTAAQILRATKMLQAHAAK